MLDEMWHTFILFTKDYGDFCHEMFGHFIHHLPTIETEAEEVSRISRGGLMTFLAAKKNPDIKAIAVWAGPTDLFSLIQRRPEFDKTLFPRLIPDYQNTKSQALTARSVLFWLDQLDEKLPILLLHGDEDKQVAVANSIDLAARLKERGQVHKLIIYPKAGHSLSPYGFAARDEIIKWFSTWLQPNPPKLRHFSSFSDS